MIEAMLPALETQNPPQLTFCHICLLAFFTFAYVNFAPGKLHTFHFVCIAQKLVGGLQGGSPKKKRKRNSIKFVKNFYLTATTGETIIWP